MKLITRDIDYALRALVFIAQRKKQIVPVSELVAALKIPRPFLRKILQILHKKGVLESYKGFGGGFLLAKPAKRIFLVDLIEVFQGEFSLNECFFKKMPCSGIATCVLRKKIDAIERYVVSQLKSITIASLVKG